MRLPVLTTLHNNSSPFSHCNKSFSYFQCDKFVHEGQHEASKSSLGTHGWHVSMLSLLEGLADKWANDSSTWWYSTWSESAEQVKVEFMNLLCVVSYIIDCCKYELFNMFLCFFNGLIWFIKCIFYVCIYYHYGWCTSFQCKRQIHETSFMREFGGHGEDIVVNALIYFPCLFSVMPWFINYIVTLATTTFTWLPFSWNQWTGRT